MQKFSKVLSVVIVLMMLLPCFYGCKDRNSVASSLTSTLSESGVEDNADKNNTEISDDTSKNDAGDKTSQTEKNEEDTKNKTQGITRPESSKPTVDKKPTTDKNEEDNKPQTDNNSQTQSNPQTPDSDASQDTGNVIEGIKVSKTGWPITEEKVSFEIMGRTSAYHTNASYMDMFKYLEKNTNVKVKYIGVSENNISERKALAIQSGDLPAAFAFSHNTFSDFELDKYANDGTFVDVSKYLKDYAPTIYSELAKYPIQKALNRTSDGKIYTLPSKTVSSDNVSYDHYLNINKAWLDKLGLDIPQTTTEFLNVMRRFRDSDPNGNNVRDEIPFAQFNWSSDMVIAGWGCHLGAGNLGVDNNYKVYFPLTSSNAKAACEYWYDFANEDGLMDTTIVGKNAAGSWIEFRSHISRGKVGCFQWSDLTPDKFPESLLKDFVAIPIPTANFSNDELNLPKAVQPYSSTPQRGKIIFTKACSSIPALLRYFDYLYTDEGIMVGNYGDPSNGLYTKLSNDNYKLTEKGEAANAGAMHAPGWTMGLPETNAMTNCKLERKIAGDSGIYSGYIKAAKTTYKKANQNNPCIRLSSIMLTSEEIVKLRKYGNEFSSSGTTGLMAYYIQSKSNALTNWTRNVNVLEAKGLSGYVSLYQSAVNRNKSYLTPMS